MKTPHIALSIIITLGSAISSTSAQDAPKIKKSPDASFVQTVGLTEISVAYNRPSARNREIFGGLVPYDKVWRTGANQSTDITFSDSVMFGGEFVEAGTYGLYSLPSEDGWKVILYRDASLWGTGQNYDVSKEVVRVDAVVFEISPALETFTIGLNYLTDTSAILHLDWVSTRVGVEIKVGDAVKM
ncbi:MAG: DUF2911 domain-containing protein [Verrucomicrobiota bacterium]